MTKKWTRVWMILGVLALVLVVFGIRGVREARSLGFLRDPVFETVREALPALDHPAVLVFSKTNAFIHKEAIPAAKQLLEGVAGERGWSIHLTDSGAIHNPEDLARFDVIVWNNVTGDVLLPEQREAMRAWLEQGGGFVALHAAGDNSHAVWPWYQNEVIRARMTGHPLSPQFQQATLHVEQPADGIVSGLPARWEREDEWYSFEASPRAPEVRVLLTIDENTYVPEMSFLKSIRMGADHPMLWKHCVGGGRVVYSAMGHTAQTYADPLYRDLLARAVNWAGRLDANASLVGSDGLACESP